MLVVLCLLFSGLAGCGKSTSDSPNGLEAVMMTPWYTDTGSSVLFYTNTDRMIRYDKKTGKTDPFCEVKNCDHQGDDCPAVRLAGTVIGAYYQGAFYDIRYNEENAELRRTALDGSNSQVIGTMSQYLDIYPVLTGGKLFYSDSEVQSNEDHTRSFGGVLTLRAMDLETGEVSDLWSLEYGEDELAFSQTEAVYGENLYQWWYTMDVNTGEIGHGCWQEINTKTNKLRQLTIPACLRSMDWVAGSGVFYVDSLDIPMPEQEEYENSFWWGNPDNGCLEKLVDVSKIGPAIWIDGGLLYVDWDQIYDSMTGTWKFYSAESQENTVIREVKLSEETMFYPELAFEQNGTEMLMGRKTMDGVKGHYQISWEDFQAGNETYELICPVEADNWAQVVDCPR